MHNFAFVKIPAKEISGSFDLDMVMPYLEKILRKHESNFDYWSVGGRWEGILAAEKGATDILLTENGLFEEGYSFVNTYDVLVNNGNRGPYIVDGKEIVPVNGGIVKNITWDVMSKFEAYTSYVFFKKILEGDPRLGSLDSCEIRDDGLYAAGTDNLMLKTNESFEEFCKRSGYEFSRYPSYLPMAYVSDDGNWHNEDECWESISGIPDNIEEAAQNMYVKSVTDFLDSLSPDDGFVIIDYHI